MFGTNKKRGAVIGDGSFLDVQKIFRTIQCEGPYVGIPAIFVRLGGCNLACSFCDTEFESFNRQNLDEILDQIILLSSDNLDVRIKFIVLTGGEPMRQPIGKLCEELLEKKFMVQIETNGILFRSIPENVDIICSPKIVDKKYSAINKNLFSNMRAVKFLISSNLDGYNDVQNIIDVVNHIPKHVDVFLQPMDQYDEVLNLANRKLAVEFAINYGYKISYQIHKELLIE